MTLIHKKLIGTQKPKYKYKIAKINKKSIKREKL